MIISYANFVDKLTLIIFDVYQLLKFTGFESVNHSNKHRDQFAGGKNHFECFQVNNLNIESD